ncbi:MAG: HipA N-terminal domain-containing protein [Flavobacteriales bacterium]|nr:HipA N-terminal domain-containing protein [Flavobacteriales bacterium]MBP9081284.1 HipA N-terminal domain-containing protein [Flavobacteriales bacterium]
MRTAKVLLHDQWVGILWEEDREFVFTYRPNYVNKEDAEPVSLTLPLQETPFRDQVLFPFFDGLIPEGWMLSIAEKSWKVHPRDRMGLLLACCRDCIGAVSIEPMDNPQADA